MTLPINYKKASIEHINDIAQLHILSWQQNYKDMLNKDYLENTAPTERLNTWQQRFTSNNPQQHVIVAIQDNKLLGFICVYADKDDELGSLLDNLHVAPNCHGQGVGKQLISRAMIWLKNHARQPSVYLEVLAGNQLEIGRASCRERVCMFV